MAITLMVGGMRTGKTRLAKLTAQAAREAGRPVLVFDPYRDEGWGADYLSPDPDEFMSVVLALDGEQPITRRCYVAWDETGWKGRSNANHIEDLVAQSGHHDLNVVLIGQKYTHIPPVGRLNIDRLYLFKQGRKGAELAAEDHGAPELKEACNLWPGQALRFDPYSTKVERLDLWPDVIQKARAKAESY